MSGQTLVERILSEKSGRDVRAGDIVIAKVDLAYVQDGTGPLTFRQMEAMGLAKAANPSRTVVFIDHASPPPRKELATDHVYLRDFGGKLGAVISDIGGGGGRPGGRGWGVMGGAMGAFASGMGSTDVAVAIGLGKTWLRVPETIRFDVKGAFPKGVYSKDLILKVIGDIKTDGATYQSMEWGGPAIHAMPMTERMVLSNMAVEAGGKCGPIPSDEETKRYLKAHNREKDWKPVTPDSDAEYEREIEVDVKELEPMVARPPQEDNVVPVTDPSVKGLRLQQVHLGSCTNARFENSKGFCDILKGEKVASGTRLIVTPASKESYEKSLKAGLFDVLLDAGAMINSPGCAACPGVHGGIPGDGGDGPRVEVRGQHLHGPDRRGAVLPPAVEPARAREARPRGRAEGVRGAGEEGGLRRRREELREGLVPGACAPDHQDRRDAGGPRGGVAPALLPELHQPRTARGRRGRGPDRRRRRARHRPRGGDRPRPDEEGRAEVPAPSACDGANPGGGRARRVHQKARRPRNRRDVTMGDATWAG